jgi:hypothetical protein
MTARNKILLVVGVFTLLVVGATLAAYAAWTREGVIVVDVDEDAGYGSQVHLEVPGAIVPLALAFVPSVCVCDDPDWREARRYMPLVRTAWREIRQAPDGVLVAVDGARERVRIEKQGTHILIDVENDGDHVRVRCPLRTVDVVTDRLVQMSGSSS